MWLFVSVSWAYADDATFFFKNVPYVTEIVAMIDYFNYLGLKSNISKCEIGGTGALKGFHMTVCRLKTVDLTSNAVKTLGVHFLFNKDIQN